MFGKCKYISDFSVNLFPEVVSILLEENYPYYVPLIPHLFKNNVRYGITIKRADDE